MRRLMVIALIVLAWSWLVGASDSFEHSIVVHRQDSFDFSGIQFYQLAIGSHGRITVSVDGDLELARYLAAHDGQRLRVRIDSTPNQEKLSR